MDYGALYENRFEVLRLAFDRFKERDDEKKEYEAFLKKEEFWLEDYALYMAIKEAQGGKSWIDWEDEDLRKRKESALKEAEKELADTIALIRFEQEEGPLWLVGTADRAEL